MTYWKNRIEQEIKARQKAEYSLDVRLNDLYDRYTREIEKEINDFYTRYAVRNSVSVSEAKKRVSEMDVQAFSSKAKQYVKEKNFGKAANEELEIYNLKMRVSRLQMLQYNIDLQLLGLSKEETKLAGEYLNQEYKREIKTQAGILGEMMENPAQMKLGMETILNTPFHGVTWKTGLREQQDAIRQIVAKATEDLIVKGKNPTTYVTKLKNDMKIKRYEAKRLLVTEGARMQTEVQKATYLENDFEEYRFIAESAICDPCKELGDKIFKVKDMKPGENACPIHPHCRCSTAPYFDRQKAIEKLKEKYKDDKELVKPKENDIINDIPKLKGTLNDSDYKEYITKLNSIENNNLRKLFKNSIDDVSKFKVIPEVGRYMPDSKEIIYNLGSSRSLSAGRDKFAVLSHEIGHHFDHKDYFSKLTYNEVNSIKEKIKMNVIKESPSQSDSFLNAVRQDKEFLRLNFLKNKDDILSSAASTGVQDALDGMFGLRDKWQVKIGHGDRYYNRIYNTITSNIKLMNMDKNVLKDAYLELGFDARSQSKVKNLTRIYETSSEVWANITEAVVSEGKTLEYVKTYLPNSYKEYIKILGNVKEK